MINYLQSVSALGVMTSVQSQASTQQAVRQLQTDNDRVMDQASVHGLNHSHDAKPMDEESVEERKRSFRDPRGEDSYLRDTSSRLRSRQERGESSDARQGRRSAARASDDGRLDLYI
ncbi:MAG: hypothetical protein HQL57_04310 [Magnetococcales bacterium]|nr:hypothetical protein [Magnetococcales bacterium]MBF0156387.1 hypothetical protein [Magnetococcales bacterium]